MSTPVLKVIVVTVLAIGIAIAVTKLIPFIILGAGVYVAYKFLSGGKPQG